MKLTFEELRHLPEPERQARIEQLVRECRKPSGSHALNDELRHFEEKYGMTTVDMLKLYNAGMVPETHEICSWLIVARAAGIKTIDEHSSDS